MVSVNFTFIALPPSSSGPFQGGENANRLPKAGEDAQRA
jgi:hypothetical protein